MDTNNFKDLEKYKITKFGESPDNIKNNIEKNINIFKTIGETVELFTDKLIKTFIKINNNI